MNSTTDQYIAALQKQNHEKGRESSVMLQRINTLQKQCQELRRQSNQQSEKQLYAKDLEIRMLREGHEKWVGSLQKQLQQFKKRYNQLKQEPSRVVSSDQQKSVRRQLEVVSELLSAQQNSRRQNIQRLRSQFVSQNQQLMQMHENRQRQHIGRLQQQLQMMRHELQMYRSHPDMIRKENEELKHILNQQNQHIDRQFGEIQQLRMELEGRNGGTPQDGEKQQLLKQLIEAKYQLNQNNAKLASVKQQSAENAQLRRRVVELEERHQADKLSIQNLTNQLQRLVQQSAASAEREQEIAKLRKQLADMKEVNYQLKTSQVQPNDEMGKLLKVISDMEKRMENLQNAYYVLSDELARNRSGAPLSPYEPIHQTIRQLKTQINRYKLSGVQLYQSMEVTAPKAKPQTPIRREVNEVSNVKNPESGKKSRTILSNIHEKLEAVRLENAQLKKSLVQIHRQVHHV